MNFLKGNLSDGKITVGDSVLAVPEGKMKVLRDQGYVNKEVILGIRPEDFHDEPVFIEASAGTKVTVNVDVSELMGAETMVYAKIGEQDFVARVDARSEVKAQQKLTLALDLNKAHFFDAETESRIRAEKE